MKTCIFFLAGMLIAGIATGQNQELEKIEVVAPSFKNENPKSIQEYLQERIEYPLNEMKWMGEGTVVIEFDITADGKLEDFNVINSVSPLLDREVMRSIKETEGMWIPANKNGEPVTMKNEVSVVFKINPKINFIDLARKHFHKANHLMFVKNQPEKALKHFNRCITLLPNDETLLATRGICKYKMGDKTGASHDWERSKILAERNGTIIEVDNLVRVTENNQEFDEMTHDLVEE